MAGRYRVVAPAIVRTEARQDSELSVAPRLEVGAEIEVTASEKVRTGTGGTANRLQFEGGWVSERAQSGMLLLERLDAATGQAAPDDTGEADALDTEQQDDSPVICIMKAVQRLRVQDSINPSSRTIGELYEGDAVSVVEEKSYQGHDRIRIVTQHAEEAWCTHRFVASGLVNLEVDEGLAEAQPWVPTHKTSVFDELVQFKVLATCTVRMGPEKDDTKVGEYSKGTVLDVVQEVINFKGITTYQSITPVKGKQTGGWVKLETSKGKTLLERIEPDPIRARCEAEVLKFLTSRGHAGIMARVCKALGSDGGDDDPTRWLSVLEELEADGELDSFLQVCRDTMDGENKPESTDAADRKVDAAATQLIELERPASPSSGGPGFGINLAPDCVITSFSHEDSCAKVAGVQVGSRILEINGEPVSSKQDAVSRLRDTQPGSSVSFLLANGGGRRWDPTAGKWVGGAEEDGSEDGDSVEGEEGQNSAEEEHEPLDFASGPVKFAVLATCTVREGPDSNTPKVGEHKQGDTIIIVNEARNSDGLKVYQTITPPKGAYRGGWVKLKTSKGKELLSVCEQFSTTDEVEKKAPDPKEPPRGLVSLQKFFGTMVWVNGTTLDRAKVKITVDGAGIFVAEDTKDAKKVLSYSTRRIVSWEVEKHKSLLLRAKRADGTAAETTFLLKNPEELEAALAGATLAAYAWKIESEAWQDDNLTPEEKEEKEAAVAQKKRKDRDARAAELRDEMVHWRLQKLQEKAADIGVPDKAIKLASDAAKAKEAVTEVIVEHILYSEAEKRRARDDKAAEMRNEMAHWRLKELRKKARDVGVPEDVLEIASDDAQPKEAVTEAIIEHVLNLEGGALSEGDPPQQQVHENDPTSHANTLVKTSPSRPSIFAGFAKKQAATAEELLQEAARMIDWQPGMVIDVDTEDGFEKGVTILGPSTEGNPKEMQVRFADGTVDNWDKEDFVFLGGDDEEDPNAATPKGKAAAIALQKEVMKHGISDVAKITKLRRASLEPADAKAARTAAAAAADAEAASLDLGVKQLSESLEKEKQAHDDAKQELQKLREKLAAADAQCEALKAASASSQTLLEQEVSAHAATKLESREKGAALDKMSSQLAALEAAHAQLGAESNATVEAALGAAATARAEANAAREALEQYKAAQQREQQATAPSGPNPDADEVLAAKDREIAQLHQKINNLEELLLTDHSSAALTWNMMDDMLTSDVLLSTDHERWT